MVRIKTFTDGADSCTCVLVNEISNPVMACTSSMWSLLSCAAAAVSATSIAGLGAAVYLYMKNNNKPIAASNTKEIMESVLIVSMGFVQFLAIAVLNFLTASMVVMFGPLVYVAKMLMAPHARKFHSILITGGNSGIGEQLALRYAEEPGVRLVLVARDEERLKAVAEKCKAKGADVIIKAVHVEDYDAMDELISDVDKDRPLDLVIANAGIANTDKTITPKIANHMIDVNVKGVFNTCIPAMARMKSRGKGQVALMSSVAGLMAIPSSAEYSASKWAVEGFGEAIRPHMATHGVGVTLICPGFVRSRMTEGMVQDIEQLHEDILLDTSVAAEIITDAISKDAANVTFPFGPSLGTRAFQVLPHEMRDAVMKGLVWLNAFAMRMNVPYVTDMLMPVVGLDRTPTLADAA